jgi:hypothetical protein
VLLPNFRSTKGWLEELNYNIGVRHSCPLFPTLFGLYIDKLKYCLEDAGCVRPTLASIVIIFLLCVDDIFLMKMSPYDLGKHLRILKGFFSSA